MAECLFVFVADLVVRRFCIVKSSAIIEVVPETDLIKVVVNIRPEKLRNFRAHPASHAYLRIPPTSRPTQNPLSLSYLCFEFISNPFTVGSVCEEAGVLTPIARQMDGPMTKTLARLASLRSPEVKVTLNIDGPYGVAAHFPNLGGTNFDRVLLAAGGVEPTFIMPLYEHIITENPLAQVEFV